jgi:hypothetical protein
MTKRYVLIDDADTDTTAVDLESGPAYVPQSTPVVPSSSGSSGFFTASAILLTYGPHILYDALSVATLTLTGLLPSTSPFRCKVTVSAILGHTDVIGRVTVGTENLDFLVAGSKVTTINLTVLPTITTSNLDCNIRIEAIDSGGAPIQDETQIAFFCDWDESTTYYPNSAGTFSRSDSNCETNEMTAKIGDKVLFNLKTYTLKNIKDGETTLGGTVLTRILQFG